MQAQINSAMQQLNGYLPEIPQFNYEVPDLKSSWNDLVKVSMRKVLQFDAAATGCKIYRKTLSLIEGMNAQSNSPVDKPENLTKASS